MNYWKTGQLIQRGRYLIEQVLGAGGAGITYRAKDVNTGEIVAIKTLNATLQAQPDFSKHQERFIQEAFRLAKCSHVHVIRVDDVCQEGELWCMIMEYIDGGNLENLVRKQGGFSEVEAIRYIYQVGSALSYIHDQGILHRDVKPANIMRRSETNEAVLIDFGLARDFVEDKTQMHTNSRTEGFAPLEQYSRTAKRGAYTDVYALSATLYYLLTLQVPFPAQFRQQGINLIPPQQHNPNISDRTNLVVVKGMELAPEHRPQSVAEWLHLLTENTEINLYSNSQNQSASVPVEETVSDNLAHKETNKAYPAVQLSAEEEIAETVTNTAKTPETTVNPYDVNPTVIREEYDPLSPNRFEHDPYRKYIEQQDVNTYVQESIETQELSSRKTEIAPPQIQPDFIPPQKKPVKKTTASFSEVGIDYRPLAELLYKQKWEQADQLTTQLMLKASGQQDSAWIDRNTMRNFPCRDLNTIDKLWLKYSKGKFGISVQKRIYLSVGGTRSYDKKTWEALGERLGWRVSGAWLFPENLNYSIDAPQGHLPSVAMAGILDRGIYTLVARTIECNVS
jgi:hypothetical protein